MPINAKPEFFQAEKKYHEAETIPEKVRALEEMIKHAPSHKGGENLRAQLKQRLSKLRTTLEKNRQASKGKGAHITVKREGAAQVVIVSVTNAGKSSLITALTNAKILVADYKYTTGKPEVGIMEFEGVQIQLVEIPAIFEDYAYKGDGPSFLSIARNADLIMFLIDTTQDEKAQLDLLSGEFEKAQIKLNAEKPKVTIKKQGLGGIEFLGKKYFDFAPKEAVKLLTSHGYHNATVTVYQKITLEDLADVLNEALVYRPMLVVYNKKDLSGKGVSSVTKEGLDELKADIFKALGLIKVITKTPGKEKKWPPVALNKGATVKDLASAIHKDFLNKFKFARIWRQDGKHNGQKVGLDYDLTDNDVVEFHIK